MGIEKIRKDKSSWAFLSDLRSFNEFTTVGMIFVEESN